jgi:tetratricopeptide (TPR) repeat protein
MTAPAPASSSLLGGRPDLEKLLNDFEEACQSGTPPTIEEFLDAAPPGLAAAGGGRREALEELVKIDLEYRWRLAVSRTLFLGRAGDRRSPAPAWPDAAGLSLQPRLEDYLACFPDLGPTERLSPDLIVEEYRVRRLCGDLPPHAEFFRRFPRQSDMLRKALRAVDAEGGREGPGGLALHADTPPVEAEGQAAPLPGAVGVAPGVTPPALPGYVLLGELGRGGMGVVYQARQVGLNRLVAIKMILAAHHAGVHEVARFRKEAAAAARLQHPNIVQIYAIGEHAGLPYFSLEYVNGGSLAQRLNGAPQPPGEAAALVEMLAHAVRFAHRHGVIHRDLKPANILLQKSEIQNSKSEREQSSEVSDFGFRISDFTPKVTDFSLAKQLDTAGSQTQSGAVMGTPSYMAPEQAAGEPRAIGPAADVYALGAILYEMLTGRPPFRGTSAFDTLEQLRSQEPVPPRRLQPRLPRDLETICLKCLAKEPGRRYTTAEDLAGDLHRFRAGEPIRARRTRWWEHAWKWARRRPALAALAVLNLGLLLALLVGGVVYQVRLRGALETATRQKELAEVRQARAVRNLEVAIGTAEGMWQRARMEGVDQNPAIRQLQTEMVQDVRRLYQELLEDKDNPDPKIRRWIGWGHAGLGRCATMLGNNEEAREEYQRARAVQEKLVADFPDVAEYRHDLAVTFFNLSDLDSSQGRFEAAEESFRQAEKLFTSLPANVSRRTAIAVHRAINFHTFGRALSLNRKPAEALDWNTRALAILEPLYRDYPEDAAVRKSLLYVLAIRGYTLGQLDRHEEALAAWDRARELEGRRDPTLISFLRARELAHVGRHAQATAEVRALAEREPISGDCARESALIFLRSIRAVEADPGIPTGERVRLLRDYLAWAADMLVNGYVPAAFHRRLPSGSSP